MTIGPICVTPTTGARELARLLEINEISGAPVVDHAGRLVGVVSKTDLIRRCLEGETDAPPSYLFELLGGGRGGWADPVPEALICVQDLMTQDALVVEPETPVCVVARRMFERRVHRAVVVDGKRFPIGIISSLDLLGAFPAPERA